MPRRPAPRSGRGCARRTAAAARTASCRRRCAGTVCRRPSSGSASMAADERDQRLRRHQAVGVEDDEMVVTAAPLLDEILDVAGLLGGVLPAAAIPDRHDALQRAAAGGRPPASRATQASAFIESDRTTISKAPASPSSRRPSRHDLQARRSCATDPRGRSASPARCASRASALRGRRRTCRGGGQTAPASAVVAASAIQRESHGEDAPSSAPRAA